jgi:hypothetical protein
MAGGLMPNFFDGLGLKVILLRAGTSRKFV